MDKRYVVRISIMFHVLMMISLLLFFSTGDLAAQDKPRYGGILRLAEGSGPGEVIGLPWEIRGGGITVFQPALEGLLINDSQGNSLPLLATSWKVAPDRSSVNISLRKGVKFHDGSDFNADVAAWNLRIRKENHVPITRSWKDIEVIDDYTIRINLKSYNNYMIADFSGKNTVMISKASYEKNGEEWMRRNIVGTGPFVFESYKRDQFAKFKRNDNYWKEGLPYLDGVELLYIKNPMTQRASLQTGEIDVLGSENGKMVADLRDMGFRIQGDHSGVTVMIPDSKNPESPFSKKAVREAVSIAIDREAIVKARGFGFWSSTQQHARKGHPGYIQGIDRPYDPEKAKRLLKEAGYPNGFETRLIPSPLGTDMNVFVAVQSYLEAIGIKARIEKVPYSKLTEYRYKGWHNGLLAHPIGVKANMNQWYDYYYTQPAKRMNWPVMQRPEGLLELLDKSISTTKLDKDLLQKVGKLVFDEVMIIPIHTTGRSYIHRKEVHDTGCMEFDRWMQWTPDRAWKSE